MPPSDAAFSAPPGEPGEPSAQPAVPAAPESPAPQSPATRSAATQPPAPPAFPGLGRELPLAPAWITVEQLSGLILTAILAAGAALLLTIATLASQSLEAPAAACAFVVLTVLLLAPAVLWPRLAYRHRSYRFEESGVHLRRGVLWRSQIAVPSTRIQHTDVSQGPIERLYGLATLTLHTAGNHYAAVSLPGLEHAAALAARDFLLAPRASDQGDAV